LCCVVTVTACEWVKDRGRVCPKVLIVQIRIDIDLINFSGTSYSMKNKKW
jgi:hypothetical protein